MERQRPRERKDSRIPLPAQAAVGSRGQVLRAGSEEVRGSVELNSSGSGLKLKSHSDTAKLLSAYPTSSVSGVAETQSSWENHEKVKSGREESGEVQTLASTERGREGMRQTLPPSSGGIGRLNSAPASGPSGPSGVGDSTGNPAAGSPGDGAKENIMVALRLRPLNDKEAAAGEQEAWEVLGPNALRPRYATGKPGRPGLGSAPSSGGGWQFDKVFGPAAGSQEVYEDGGVHYLVESALQGINATVFAYGMTGSGKTYTMKALMYLALNDLFQHISKGAGREFSVRFSGVEIYNEVVKDLLNPASGGLRLLDDPERGTVVERLSEEGLRSVEQALELLDKCDAERSVGETSLNDVSSRSHQIVRLTIESLPRPTSTPEGSPLASPSSTPGSAGGGQVQMLTATLNFVDLAGSERCTQTGAEGVRLKEGAHINRSLLTLGTVIRKLSGANTNPPTTATSLPSSLGAVRHESPRRDGDRGGVVQHIPYRDSKLTRILQQSLGGNGRTLILGCISPALSHADHTRNTLAFAATAKLVRTSAHVNMVVSDKAMVASLKKDVARLQCEVEVLRSQLDDAALQLLHAQQAAASASATAARMLQHDSASSNSTAPDAEPRSPVACERCKGKENGGGMQDGPSVGEGEGGVGVCRHEREGEVEEGGRWGQDETCSDRSLGREGGVETGREGLEGGVPEVGGVGSPGAVLVDRELKEQMASLCNELSRLQAENAEMQDRLLGLARRRSTEVEVRMGLAGRPIPLALSAAVKSVPESARVEAEAALGQEMERLRGLAQAEGRNRASGDGEAALFSADAYAAALGLEREGQEDGAVYGLKQEILRRISRCSEAEGAAAELSVPTDDAANTQAHAIEWAAAATTVPGEGEAAAGTVQGMIPGAEMLQAIEARLVEMQASIDNMDLSLYLSSTSAGSASAPASATSSLSSLSSPIGSPTAAAAAARAAAGMELKDGNISHSLGATSLHAPLRLETVAEGEESVRSSVEGTVSISQHVGWEKGGSGWGAVDAKGKGKRRSLSKVDAKRMLALFKQAADDQLASVKEYVVELREQVVKLHFQKQLLLCQVLELETQNREVSAQNSLLSREKEALGSSAVRLGRENGDLNAKKTEIESKAQAQEKERSLLAIQVGTLKAQNRELQSRVESLEKAVQVAEAAVLAAAEAKRLPEPQEEELKAESQAKGAEGSGQSAADTDVPQGALQDLSAEDGVRLEDSSSTSAGEGASGPECEGESGSECATRPESSEERERERELHRVRLVGELQEVLCSLGMMWHQSSTPLVQRTETYLFLRGKDAETAVSAAKAEQQRVHWLLTQHGGRGSADMFRKEQLGLERDRLLRVLKSSLRPAERDSLFSAWGVPRRSKQRKVHLVARIWDVSYAAAMPAPEEMNRDEGQHQGSLRFLDASAMLTARLLSIPVPSTQQ